MLATVRELGLAGRPNVSFPRGLRSSSASAPGATPSIDVGTNSVKFHVGERDADGAWATVVDRAEVTRLGEGLAETGRLQHGADRAHGRRDRRRWSRRREQDGVLAMAAVGTAGLRIAPNAAELSSTRSRDALRRRRRGASRATRRRGSRTSRRRRRLGLGDGRSSCSTPAAAARSSRSARGDSVDERFSVDVGAVALHRALRAGAGGGRGRASRAAQEAIAADLSRLDGRPAARRARRASAAPTRTSPP